MYSDDSLIQASIIRKSVREPISIPELMGDSVIRKTR